MKYLKTATRFLIDRAYHYDGSYNDRMIQGRGYIEYIDRRVK